MRVKELLAALQQCDPESTVEDAEGSEITNVCYEPGQKRVSLSNEDELIPDVALGHTWSYIFRE